jgi:pimeloyl-ACP methyl ester carboxylesterase
MKEEALHFGEGGRLFGILTTPVRGHDASSAPVFVLLNAGLLHRVGPFRMHVRLARALAYSGFATVRLDLSGRGDSPRRPGMNTLESVPLDHADVDALLRSRFGPVPRVFAGLCAGADNAVRFSLRDPHTVGLVLLDPVTDAVPGYRRALLVQQLTTPGRYAAALKRTSRSLGLAPADTARRVTTTNPLALRDLPTREDMRTALEAIHTRRGHVLAVFTSYALDYYSAEGQLASALGLDPGQQYCTERFWPEAEHTYTLESHRQRVISEIVGWANRFRQKPVGG